jgi:hypothetical protein
MGWVVKATPWPLYPRKRPRTHRIGPVWTDAENLAPTEIRSPDPPGRSESLYRLRNSGPLIQGDVDVQSTNSEPRHYMDVSGQLHVLSALPSGKNPGTHRIAGLGPQNRWMLWGKEKSLAPAWILHTDCQTRSLVTIWSELSWVPEWMSQSTELM